MTEARDGKWFLAQVDATCERLRQRARETESWIDESSGLSEDVAGRVRAVVGKAELLVSKKLNQFRDLCVQNVAVSSGRDSH